MKKSGFKMRSGNGPLKFKDMGTSSPIKYGHDRIDPDLLTHPAESTSYQQPINYGILQEEKLMEDFKKAKNPKTSKIPFFGTFEEYKDMIARGPIDPGSIERSSEDKMREDLMKKNPISWMFAKK